MALEKITKVTGRGVHVPGSDVDTDRIIPARFMKCVTFEGLGEFLFHDARRHEDGSPKDHPLNDPKFAGASILLAGSNFGCGSSREHAPQALYRHGIRGIIAESFAEIFFGNCTTLGMPCAMASGDDIASLTCLVAEDPAAEITIDIENRQATAGNVAIPLSIPDTAREALLGGEWDPIGELLEGAPAVADRVAQLPYLSTW